MRITDAYLETLLQDDCPYADLTTEGLGIGRVEGVIEAFPKKAGVVAGLAAAKRLFELRGAKAELFAEDGDRVEAGTVILRAEGCAEALHAVYKTAQNLMEYASGIAGRVRAMADEAQAANDTVRVALTRKHMPGTKPLVYAAVRAGGGIVHRYGLSDSILVFDQHRVFAKDPVAALRRLKMSEPERKIAVEVADVEEGLRYARAGADILQCERFDPKDVGLLRSEARRIRPHLVLMAAGGISVENARAYALAGADVLVTSWPYHASPFDIKMRFSCAEPGGSL